MNNRHLILTTASIFILTLMIAITPSIISVMGVNGNSTGFNVTLTVTVGSPTITAVYNVSDSPTEGTTKLVQFFFNASHPNGVANIPASGAFVSINQSGTYINTSNCSIVATDSVTVNKYACNLTINYYNLPGFWSINATINDTSNNRATSLSANYTNGNTYGIAIKTTSVTFSGSAGSSNVGASTNPQFVNNTGNVPYTQINLTAYNLASGSNGIGVGNFTANTTDGSGVGAQLVNNTAIVLNASNISVSAYRNIYLYMNIPTGTTNGTYTSSSSWILTLQ